jgi:CobQ-like glutamine amidotransferase family enzyme
MPKFSILHLYPTTLHLNGEVGNVVALVERGKASGLDVTVQSLELGEGLPSSRPDLIFIGSGILSAVRVASEDLKEKAPRLIDWVTAGAKVLAVGGGFDLISKGLEVEPGHTLFGLGLTDTKHRVTRDHLVGEVVTETGLAGFINWNREIERASEESSLSTVSVSDESRLVGYKDGYRSGNVIATNIQGPFLPMNPSIADELLGLSGEAPERIKTLNTLAEKAREAISRRVNR